MNTSVNWKQWIMDPARHAAHDPAWGWRALDHNGRGILHCLAECENQMADKTEASILAGAAVKAGADINCQEFEMGNTPLHWCVWNSSAETASAIIDAGAVLAIRNRRDETPMNLCEFLLRTVVYQKPAEQQMARIRLAMAAKNDECFLYEKPLSIAEPNAASI